MKRILALAVVAPLLIANSPGAVPAADCAGVAGHERLTADGFELTFDAPGVLAPELAATNEQTGDVVTPHRTASFPFYLDLAPYSSADLDVSLTWADPSDYDVYLFSEEDGTEFRAGGSDTANLEESTTAERFTYQAADCEAFRIAVRNWAGSPAQALTLDITVTPTGTPADGVAPRTTSVTPFYLAGDRPGQLGTLQQGSPTGVPESPLSTGFTTERPTANVGNAITRPVVGFDGERNPLQPYWWEDGNEDVGVHGTASAVVWVQSQTQEHEPGTLRVQLFVNGTAQTVEIDGARVGPNPTPFYVAFPDVIDEDELYSLTLQVTATPVVSTAETSDRKGDANHTVWYDSVQFQSVLYLPLTTP